MKAMSVLLIDNYDSFTYNLYQLVMMVMNGSGTVTVIRNDENEALTHFLSDKPDAIIISPGPGNPSDTGLTMEILDANAYKVPILGVCLGMQCINELYGGKTVRAPYPVHGKQRMAEHGSSRLFVGIPRSFPVARYHSLMIDNVQNELRIIATSVDDGYPVPMAVEHAVFPVFGVQFHPESFMTPHGAAIIRNFLGVIA